MLLWKFYSYLLLPLPTVSSSLMHAVIWKCLVYVRLPAGKLEKFFFFNLRIVDLGFPGGSGVKNPPAMQESQEMQVRSLGWRRAWPFTPIFVPGESHGQRRVAGYSSQGCKESDAAEAA